MITYFPVPRLVLLGLCASMFLLPACEEVVDLGFEVPKSRLVINANFVAGEPVTLRVSATRLPGAPTVSIEEARVMLFEGEFLAEELSYFHGRENQRSGEYRTSSFLPREGRQYTIHVAAEGYDPVTAVSSIPTSTVIRSLLIEGLSSKRANNVTVYDYTLAIDYDDPDEETNFYDLRISQKIIPFTLNQRGDTVQGKAYVRPVDTPQERTDTNETLSVLIRDTNEQYPLTVHLQSHLISNKEILGGIVAELRTVSPEYYFYRLSLGAQPPSGRPGGGLREPQILYNNVDMGLGIFAGYNSVKQHVYFAME